MGATCTITGAHNLGGGKPPFIERSVYYHQLTPASVQVLSELSREHGMQALLAVNRRAMELQREDVENPDATLRMNFGIYYYSAPLQAPGASEVDDD